MQSVRLLSKEREISEVLSGFLEICPDLVSLILVERFRVVVVIIVEGWARGWWL